MGVQLACLVAIVSVHSHINWLLDSFNRFTIFDPRNLVLRGLFITIPLPHHFVRS